MSPNTAASAPFAPPPLVSVIITCYNGARWIADAVDSALAQSYPRLEIIVVDDASADDSPDILRRYATDERVQLVLQDTNRGIPATKNAGVARSSGQYIAFLEQDDVWFEHKLERQVTRMEGEPALGMVFADAVVAGPDERGYRGRSRHGIPAATEECVKTFFLFNPVVSMSSALFRRAVLADLGGFDESYAGGDDYELFLRLVGRHRVARIDEPLLRYRWSYDSFSWEAMDRMLHDQLLTVQRAVALYPYLGPLRRRRTAHVWLSAALRSFEAGATSRAFGWAWRALRADPSFLRTVPACLLMTTGGLGRWILRRRRWTVLFARVP
jgi:glycosyltransferase involved in cell wall biosynthesis